jgi:hypothetical protein
MVPTVEAETCEVMQDHLMSRLPELKLQQVNDTCYVDTFFLSVKSVKGFTCWMQYSFKKSGYDVAGLFDATLLTRSIDPSKDGYRLWCPIADQVRQCSRI